MHHGTPQKKGDRPTRAHYALWNVAWSPRVPDIWEKRSKTADPDRRPWPTISKHFQTLGNATINRYFEVGTIIRINRLKPVNCSTKFITVALINSLSGKSLPVKVRLKKNLEAEKLDGNQKLIKFPVDYRRVFFWLRFFFGLHLYKQTPGIYLRHKVSITVETVENVWLWQVAMTNKIKTFENATINRNFGLEQTFKSFKNLQKHIPASRINQGYSTVLNLLHY